MKEQKDIKFTDNMFKLAQTEGRIHDKKFDTKPLSYMQDAWKRFKKNKSSIVAFIVICCLILFAIVGPMVTPYTIGYVDSNMGFMHPRSRISVALGLDFWDGCIEKEIAKNEFLLYYAMGEELGEDYAVVKNNEFEVIKTPVLDKQGEETGEVKELFIFRFNDYQQKGCIVLKFTLEEFQRLQAYQDETGIQVIYPWYEIRANDIATQDQGKANYWYQTEIKDGKTVPVYTESVNEDGEVVFELQNRYTTFGSHRYNVLDENGDVIYVAKVNGVEQVFDIDANSYAVLGGKQVFVASYDSEERIVNHVAEEVDGKVVYYAQDENNENIYINNKHQRVEVDADGYILDEDGNQELNKSGNPILATRLEAKQIKASAKQDEIKIQAIYLDKDGNRVAVNKKGNIVNANGQEILENGKSVRAIKDFIYVNRAGEEVTAENGIFKDKYGNEVFSTSGFRTDDNGQEYYIGSDYYTSSLLVDEEDEAGHRLYSYSRSVQGGGLEARVNYYEYYVYEHTVLLEDGISEPYFIFGSDGVGRDIFVRLSAGARLSFLIAIIVASVNLFVGAMYGAVEGYYGGVLDLVMERIVEILGAIPFMVVITLLRRFLGLEGRWENTELNLLVLFISFFLTGWIGMAARTRMQFYRFKNQEYVLAARTLGARDGRLMFKHIFPNSLGTLITGSVLIIPGVIFQESSLSYLGILDLNSATMTSVGNMLSNAQPHLAEYPYMILTPALFISLLMLSFNLFGNGLRDAFNPSLRGAED